MAVSAWLAVCAWLSGGRRPTREDIVNIVLKMYQKDGLTRHDIESLVDTFPNQSLDFFGALRSRTYDHKIKEVRPRRPLPRRPSCSARLGPMLARDEGEWSAAGECCVCTPCTLSPCHVPRHHSLYPPVPPLLLWTAVGGGEWGV